MAYGAGEADMAAAWEQYLQNHNVNHQVQLQDPLREIKPHTESKKKEGAGKRKTKKNRTILPRIRKVSYKNKKHRYKLKEPFSKRKKAIHEGVKMEAEMKGRTIRKAAIAKKGRFNVLRIYRRNKKIKECNTITHDMRYMDKKYGLGKTKNICGKKGGGQEINKIIEQFVLLKKQNNPRNLKKMKELRIEFYKKYCEKYSLKETKYWGVCWNSDAKKSFNKRVSNEEGRSVVENQVKLEEFEKAALREQERKMKLLEEQRNKEQEAIVAANLKKDAIKRGQKAVVESQIGLEKQKQQKRKDNYNLMLAKKKESGSMIPIDKMPSSSSSRFVEMQREAKTRSRSKLGRGKKRRTRKKRR